MTHDGKRINWGEWAITSDDPSFSGTGNKDSGDDYEAAPGRALELVWWLAGLRLAPQSSAPLGWVLCHPLVLPSRVAHAHGCAARTLAPPSDLDHHNPQLRDSLVDWLNWMRRDVGCEGWCAPPQPDAFPAQSGRRPHMGYPLPALLRADAVASTHLGAGALTLCAGTPPTTVRSTWSARWGLRCSTWARTLSTCGQVPLGGFPVPGVWNSQAWSLRLHTCIAAAVWLTRCALACLLACCAVGWQ